MVSLFQRLSRSGALTSACLHVHVGRALLLSFPCRSQRCHDISRIGSSEKVIHTVPHTISKLILLFFFFFQCFFLFVFFLSFFIFVFFFLVVVVVAVAVVVVGT